MRVFLVNDPIIVRQALPILLDGEAVSDGIRQQADPTTFQRIVLHFTVAGPAVRRLSNRLVL